MPSLDTKKYFYNLLMNNAALVTALGTDARILDAYPDSFTTFPVLAYSEINSRNLEFFDNVALSDEVTFQVDLFHTASTTAIAKLINSILEPLLFTRDFSQDVPNTDSKIYHRVMRYRRAFTADDLD